MLTGLERISLMFPLIFVRYWFLMTNGRDAAVYQLRLYEDLLEFKKFDPSLADAVITRMQHHLW